MRVRSWRGESFRSLPGQISMLPGGKIALHPGAGRPQDGRTLSDTPHIAYLFSRWPVVSQTFCDTEMLALEARGFRITVGSLNPPPDSFRHERLARLRAEAIYPPPGPVLDAALDSQAALKSVADDHAKRFGDSFKPRTRARNAAWFGRELRARGVQHVHVHFANRATHTALFLKELGLPFSFTAHAQDFMVDLKSDDLLREMIRAAEFTVAVSDFSRGLLVEKCPDAAEKIVRIYNGMEASVFGAGAAREAHGGPLRIVSIGRLIEFKGFHRLIEAMRLLRESGTAVELDIVGEGPWREQLAEQIRSAGLEGNVRLCGVRSQDQIRAMLAAADVFALGCIVDGKGAMDILPTVILEAMASGLPVVSTTLAGVPEMVIHGVNGLLAEPGNATGLAAHLATLAGDAALRARMGAAGRARVEEVFALDVTAGRLAQMFRERAVDSSASSFRPPSALEPLPAQGDVLCLLEDASSADSHLAAELAHLSTLSRVEILAAECSGKPVAACSYLPDAVVLESVWKSEPGLAAACEKLRDAAGPVHGETFYRCARRAVWLAKQLPHRGWRQVHALRASSALTAWLLGKLSGISTGVTVESLHGCSRATLKAILPDFARGSVSDAKCLPDKSPLADLLQLAPPPEPRRILGIRLRTPAPQPDAALIKRVWADWLTPPQS